MIRIEAHDWLTVNGTVSANGEVPPLNDNVGSGSGGSIWISAHRLAGSGAITAHGGAGGKNSGAGGGGRIAIWRVVEAPGSTLHSTTKASKGGGSGQNNLEDGTVYWGRLRVGTIMLLR